MIYKGGAASEQGCVVIEVNCDNGRRVDPLAEGMIYNGGAASEQGCVDR
jgi:hypothetical protein